MGTIPENPETVQLLGASELNVFQLFLEEILLDRKKIESIRRELNFGIGTSNSKQN